MRDDLAPLRICDKPRAADLDVWFGQSELRGGDGWDASIRRQIEECALFVPIISANTQAREEGCFRREGNRAVNRRLDMADKAFEWLDRAYAKRDPGVTHSAKDELFSALHGNPRWQAQLQRMGLAWSRRRRLPLIPP